MENENGAIGNPFLNQPKQTPEGALKFTDEPAAPAPQPFNVPQQLINNTQQPMGQMSQTPIQPEAAIETQVKYAGFWIRWVAGFIDNIILQVVGFIFGVIFGIVLGITGMAKLAPIISGLLGFILVWAYNIFMIHKYQATLGKMAVGVKVISAEDGSKISLGKVILRETIGKLISLFTLLVGYIMAGFTARKQALHDKIANSVVVYKDPNKKVTAWVIVVVVIGAVLVMIATIGILASIVLVSLNSARQKASDAAIKSSISAQIPAAIIYYDNGNSFKGFKPAFQFNDTVKKCAGDPIVNISADGQAMAIFAKSCSKDIVYFCDDATSSPNYIGQIIEVDEQYAKSGAVSCGKALSQAKSDASGSAGTSSATDQAALPNTYQDDKLGFEIKYPGDWTQAREEDKETGIVSVAFGRDMDNSPAGVAVQGVTRKNNVDTAEIDFFAKGIEKKIVQEKGKNYDEKNVTYKFRDGTTVEGREFKSEYVDNNGAALKQRMTVIASGKKILWFSYIATADQFDSYSDIAAAMFNSWVVEK